MDRRTFVRAGLTSAAALGTTGVAAAQAETRHFLELRTYELRNDIEPARVHAFFEKTLVPALTRLGVGPVGVFTPEMGMHNPSLVLLLDFPSLEAYAGLADRLRADAGLQAAQKELEVGRVPYVRYESQLLRAFAAHPRVEVTTPAAGRPARLFELRVYEAPGELGLAAKVEMFNQEEIAIFRKVGINPVFFGEGVAGTRLPHLTYLTVYDDMAARTRAWDTFRVDPDWVRIRNRPGWTNPETVSGQRIAFLRPTAYSQVR